MLLRRITLAQIDRRSYLLPCHGAEKSTCHELDLSAEAAPNGLRKRSFRRPVLCRLLISPHTVNTTLVRLPRLHSGKLHRALSGLIEQQAGCPTSQLLWDACWVRPSPHDPSVHEYAIHYTHREKIAGLYNKLLHQWGWHVSGISTTLHALARQHSQINLEERACYVICGEEFCSVGLAQKGQLAAQRILNRKDCSFSQIQETMAAFRATYRLGDSQMPIYLWDLCQQLTPGLGEWSQVDALALKRRDRLGLRWLLEHAHA